MIAIDVAPNPNDVSRLVSNLILTGHISASVEMLYEGVPLKERDGLIKDIIAGTYALLPDEFAESTRRWQDVCEFGISTPSATAPKRKGTAFDGLKVGLAAGLLISMVVFAIYFSFSHQSSFHLPATALRSDANASVSGSKNGIHSFHRVPQNWQVPQ